MSVPNRITCLSNIFDQHYHDVRGEKIERHLTTPFRRDLFRCLEMASGLEVLLLSSPPKAAARRGGKWLPPVETEFSTHRQLYCASWDIPKLRIPLSWIFYAGHVLRHVRSGDLVVIDNYELIYILAARLVHIFRRVTFVLVYLDGKHLIDSSWDRLFSGFAEWAGRPLLAAALLSNPTLGKRLPDAMPKELVPGFVQKQLPRESRLPDKEVRFLYTGALAFSKGVDLLLESLEYLPEQGWRLTIAGQGELTDRVIRTAHDPRWRSRVEYQEPLPPEDFERLLAENHVGLNCQRISETTADVTFPSKVFTYLSAGLLVVSSKAGCVKTICSDAVLYYEGETPQALANAMKEVIGNFMGVRQKLDPTAVTGEYSFEASTARLRRLLQTIGVMK